MVQPQRHAEAEGQVVPLRAGEYRVQGLQGAFQQRLGVEEVGAGIAGETQFGEEDVGSPLLTGRFDLLEVMGHVLRGIAHAYAGYGDGQPDEAVAANVEELVG